MQSVKRTQSNKARNWFVFAIICGVVMVGCFIILGEQKDDRYTSDENGGTFIAIGLLSLLCMAVGFIQAWQARRAAQDPTQGEM